MSGLHLRVHLHSAAVAFRPGGGCATATTNAGIKARCTEGHIA